MYYTCKNAAVLELSVSKSWVLLKSAPFSVAPGVTPSLVFIIRHPSKLLPLFSQMMSKWSVSLRRWSSLSMNSFNFPLKTFPISAPYLFPRFQISWFSAGPHFVKKLHGSCPATKFHSVLSSWLSFIIPFIPEFPDIFPWPLWKN